MKLFAAIGDSPAEKESLQKEIGRLSADSPYAKGLKVITTGNDGYQRMDEFKKFAKIYEAKEEKDRPKLLKDFQNKIEAIGVKAIEIE